MSYENIQVAYPNFCIGPQAGTFCSIDTSSTQAVLRVKSSTGSLIRTYDFYPADTLHVDSHSSTYPYNKPVAIQYVGPYNQNGFYTGLPFYTLERVRKTGYPDNYSDECIIRKWILNQESFRLELSEVYTKTGAFDSTTPFNSKAFAIETIKIELDWHVSKNTSFVDITTTSGLAKYDVIMIGPSTDNDNIGAVEYVYVQDVVDDKTIEIRTTDSYIPTKYEYVQGDPVTIFKGAYLFSNLGVYNTITAVFTPTGGRIYKLDIKNYFSTIGYDDGGVYTDVIAAKWNNTYAALSFVNKINMLTVDISDYEIIKSQIFQVVDVDDKSILTVYDIDFDGYTIYRLQSATTRKGDTLDSYTKYTWSNYNYQEDALLPYSFSVSLDIAPSATVTRQDTVNLVATVRDQFGVTLSNKNINFYKQGDAGAYFTPTDGHEVSDINGRAEITYTSYIYDGNVTISVRSDGSSSSTGSQYVWCKKIIISKANFSGLVGTSFIKQKVVSFPSTLYCKQIKETPTINNLLSAYTQFKFPGGHVGIAQSAGDGKIIKQAYIPYLHSATGRTVTGGSILIPTYITSKKTVNNLGNITQKAVVTSQAPVSQTYISRHYTSGHKDSVTVDQFTFVQEARPSFWSEKNPLDTDIWLRLRPFAASLNPDSLVIKIKEYYYDDKEEWRDITSNGTITIFDAGGGLNGLEFQWYPESGIYFHNNGIVYVQMEVYDTVVIPNKIILDYWFMLVPDFRAPALNNIYPAREEYSVGIDTIISFDIIDIGSGIDIDSFEMQVNYKRVFPTVTKINTNNYNVVYTPPKSFDFEDIVSVEVKVGDKSEYNNTLLDTWRFYCSESTAPWFNDSNFSPGRCVEALPRNTSNISFQVYGVGDGVSESIEVTIGGKERIVTIVPIVYRLQ